jgi:hypothetical protein
MLLYDQNTRCREFLKTRIPSVREWDARAQTIGQTTRGQLTAVAIFENFNTHDIEVSLAIDGRATPAFPKAVFRYVFTQLGCRRMTAMVPMSSARTIELATRLGFVLEGCKRDATPAGDMLMFGLLRKECRYVSPDR